MFLKSVYYMFWQTKTTDRKGAFRVEKNISKKLAKRKRVKPLVFGIKRYRVDDSWIFQTQCLLK
jgi:hypothetical protein